ncbi:MAG: DNA polymerase III subunit delta' [Deltaproteobacteria bacterium]|nr:DNA polymerase III subunit delta' [Deltaproteobacteria bacterium]
MWSKILGHDKQVAQLKKVLSGGQIPHAFLFCGPEGIGKRKTAVGLAQALNCEARTGIPCEDCLACQKIEKNIHPDCLLIEPEGKAIKIDTLREMKQKACLHPLEGRSKVFLIDPAEAMTTAGANALLKILEEPPAETFFILITSKASLLLPTIRSRCRRLDFQPLSGEILQKILSAAGFAKTEADLRTALSQGSAARALSWDLNLFEKAKACWEKLEAGPAPSLLFQFSEACAEEEEQLPFILGAFGHLAHQKLMAAEAQSEIERRARQWQAVGQALHLLDTYANKRLLVENLLFTLQAA